MCDLALSWNDPHRTPPRGWIRRLTQGLIQGVFLFLWEGPSERVDSTSSVPSPYAEPSKHLSWYIRSAWTVAYRCTHPS